jgi:hypothetical protein
MTASSVTPSASAYAIQLLATAPQDPERLAGRLEHVLSGRRHDFANGQALLACLAFEQQQALLEALAAPASPAGAAPPAGPPSLRARL